MYLLVQNKCFFFSCVHIILLKFQPQNFTRKRKQFYSDNQRGVQFTRWLSPKYESESEIESEYFTGDKYIHPPGTTIAKTSL